MCMYCPLRHWHNIFSFLWVYFVFAPIFRLIWTLVVHDCSVYFRSKLFLAGTWNIFRLSFYNSWSFNLPFDLKFLISSMNLNLVFIFSNNMQTGSRIDYWRIPCFHLQQPLPLPLLNFGNSWNKSFYFLVDLLCFISHPYLKLPLRRQKDSLDIGTPPLIPF